MTRGAVAAATSRLLQLHEPSLRYIEGRFAEFGWKMADNNRQQAMMPAGGVVLDNPQGSAPGFIVDDGIRVVVTLPGPPHELRPMLHDHAKLTEAEFHGASQMFSARRKTDRLASGCRPGQDQLGASRVVGTTSPHDYLAVEFQGHRAGRSLLQLRGRLVSVT